MIDQKAFDELAQANKFAVYNGISLHLLEDGRTTAVMDMGPNSVNPYGRLHGGAIYTLADCAGGALCRTDGREYVTLDGMIHFIRSAKSGTITATAGMVHRGRTTSVVDIRVTDQDGTLLATGDFTFFCLGGG